MDSTKLNRLVIIMFITELYFGTRPAHICTVTKQLDPTTNKMRWAVPRIERCFCQGVRVMHSILRSQKCSAVKEDDTEQWFIDDVTSLTDHRNWVKKILDEILQRDECFINECDSIPCKNFAVCHDRVGRYICQCMEGFKGINCEVDYETPIITCPGYIATNTDQIHTTIFYNVSAVDNSRKIPQVFCSHESGTQFDIGETKITCEALDEAGNSAKCLFSIDVKALWRTWSDWGTPCFTTCSSVGQFRQRECSLPSDVCEGEAKEYTSRDTHSCNAYPLGMQDGTILDSQITASSTSSSGPPHDARLLGTNRWNSETSKIDASPWIQVDFRTTVRITGMKIQGSGGNAYVKTLQIQTGVQRGDLSYIMEANTPATFTANSNPTSVVTITLPQPVCVRYFRINPKEKRSDYVHGLRFEVMGFKKCPTY